MTDSKSLVPCYVCYGKKMRQGVVLGCDLCKTHGTGSGKLYETYRHQEVIIGEKTYTPPNYECVWCEDVRTAMQVVWDNRRRTKSWDGGVAHWMPKVDLPCFSCREYEFRVAYYKAQFEIISRPVGYVPPSKSDGGFL